MAKVIIYEMMTKLGNFFSIASGQISASNQWR